MRRFYITMIAGAAMATTLTAAGQHVSTEPQLRNVLIEEYTGVNCGNCPDGHLRAHKLAAANPGIFHSVAIHAGHYSETKPDFTTPGGNEIHDYYNHGAVGLFYPSGMVNRVTSDLPGENGNVLGRGSWGRVGWDEHLKTAPVNLWAEASYDNATRKLDINVEGYFTENVEGATLAIYLLESDIIAQQGGAGANYHHNHMLRDIVTETWGDKIDKPTKGESFVKKYEYTVPEKVKETAVDPANISLIILVSDKDRLIQNSIENYPTLSGVTVPNRVNFEEWVLTPGNIWGFNYFEGMIHNKSAEAVTKATFTVSANGVTKDIEWTGEVAPHSASRITIPLPEEMRIAPGSEAGFISARIKDANGKAIEGADKNSASFKVRGANLWPNEISVSIKTDNDNTQNTWRLLDADGNVVKEYGPYPQGEVTEVKDHLVLDNDKTYCFEIYDCVGNGVKNPRGQIVFRDGEGSLVGQVKEIADYGVRQFFHTDSSLNKGDLGVDSNVWEQTALSYSAGVVTADSDTLITVYTAGGVKAAEGVGRVDLSPLAKGIYVAVSGSSTLKIAL